jgi:hypothetical protein
VRLAGSYPLEAEQDSFYVARGGFPDSLHIRSGTPGAVSLRGAFADYAPDTLDYQFHPAEGIAFETLARYRVVCWYTDAASAQRQGSKFGPQPATAIRVINSVNRLNTLAVYLQAGGSAWIFGEGMTSAIGNGYFSRYGTVPPVPYTAGEDPFRDVLSPGNFLYDFCHLRSELDRGGPLASCIPNLPEFRGPASPADRSHDPRIGPGADRVAARWSGLPRHTIGAYRGAPAAPTLGATWLIRQPNTITTGPPAFAPTLDTLYLFQSPTYDPTPASPEDGRPNAVHYHGTDNGPGSQLVWFGFPLHFFEREQVRTVVERVMTNLGVVPAPAAARGGHRSSRGGKPSAPAP